VSVIRRNPLTRRKRRAEKVKERSEVNGGESSQAGYFDPKGFFSLLLFGGSSLKVRPSPSSHFNFARRPRAIFVVENAL